MKLSQKTFAALRSLAQLNTGIVIQPGHTLTTISVHSSVYAKVQVPDEFDREFGIYELPRFLAAVSLFTEPEVITGETSLVLKDERRQLTYTYCDPSMVVRPPSGKALTLPPASIAQFVLPAAALSDAVKAMSVLKLPEPEIALSGDGGGVSITVSDARRESRDVFGIRLADHTATFRAVFKVENLRLLPRDYAVELTPKAARFSCDDAEYFIAIEEGSSI